MLWGTEEHACGTHVVVRKKNVWSWFSPCIFTWILGTKLKLRCSHFYLLSHLKNPNGY